MYLYMHVVIYVCTHPSWPQDYVLSDTKQEPRISQILTAQSKLLWQSQIDPQSRYLPQFVATGCSIRCLQQPATLLCPIPDNFFLNNKPIFFLKCLNYISCALFTNWRTISNFQKSEDILQTTLPASAVHWFKKMVCPHPLQKKYTANSFLWGAGVTLEGR